LEFRRVLFRSSARAGGERGATEDRAARAFRLARDPVRRSERRGRAGRESDDFSGAIDNLAKSRAADAGAAEPSCVGGVRRRRAARASARGGAELGGGGRCHYLYESVQ